MSFLCPELRWRCRILLAVSFRDEGFFEGESLLLVMLCGLAFVFPVAVYCLILASLNRRPHPVMVSGPWDFAEVLLACSGFLLFGGPAILTGFHQRWRDYWLYGNKRVLRGLSGDWSFWLALWAAYFLVVLAGAAFLLWRRRLATAIYNVDPPVFRDRLARVLDHLQLDWAWGEQRVFIGAPRSGKAAAALPENIPGLADEPPPRHAVATLSHRRLVLDIDAFPAMRHVTLSWPADAGPLREEIEAELSRALADVHTAHNPVGAWMLSLATCLFVAMFFTLLFVLLVIARRYQQ